MILVNGVKLTALFGTASSYSVITQAAAEKAGVKTPMRASRRWKRSQGRWLGNFTVNVGGEEMKNAPLEIAQANGRYYDVLIGADYFLTHHLYVANSQQKIYATRTGLPANAPCSPRTRGDPGGMEHLAAQKPRAASGSTDGWLT